ncbi:hypothetical protein GH733_013425, partial [Mirounga leonina]
MGECAGPGSIGWPSTGPLPGCQPQLCALGWYCKSAWLVRIPASELPGLHTCLSGPAHPASASAGPRLGPGSKRDCVDFWKPWGLLVVTQATRSRKVTATGTATKKPLKKALAYLLTQPCDCAIPENKYKISLKKVRLSTFVLTHTFNYSPYTRHSEFCISSLHIPCDALRPHIQLPPRQAQLTQDMPYKQ